MSSRHDDRDDWSPEEDDLVRAALLSLREDVDDLPLAAPAAIKARGSKRRRTVWLASAAGLAAAGLAVAAVGLSGILQPDQRASDPASDSATSLSRTSSPMPSTTGSPSSTRTWSTEEFQEMIAESKVLLPRDVEWQAALQLGRAPTVASGTVPELLCAMPVGAGMAVDAQDVAAAGAPSSFATQVVFRYASDTAAQDAAAAMTAEVRNCQTPRPTTLTQQSTDRYSEHPAIWSFTDTDGNEGWLTVTQRGRDVVYVEMWHTASGDGMTATLDQFARLTNVVENRLERYGAGVSLPTGDATDTPDRHLAGPADMPQAHLFLDPRAFTSRFLTGDATAEAGPGAWEGSPVITEGCDADTSGEGTFALMRVKRQGVDASYFATQRVREVFFGDGDAKALVDAEIKRLTDGFTGCTVRNGQTTTTSTAGPAAGQFQLVTTFDDNSAPITEFVAVSATGTPGYVSTIVLWTTAPEGIDSDSYWAQLARLTTLVAAR
ncbi:MAG: hypothetical protein V9G19_15735 [Tetrasphaera sp.]